MTIKAPRKPYKSICLSFTKREYDRLTRLSKKLARSKNQTIRMAIDHWLTHYDDDKE